MIMKILQISLCSLFMLFMVACSTTGPMIAANGKTYYLNSSDCAKYTYWRDKDYILCYNEDGQSTGYRYPMSQASLNAYYRQQEQQQKQIQKSFDDLNNSLERNNQMMQQQNMMMYQQNMRMYEMQRLNNNINCIGKPFCTTY